MATNPTLLTMPIAENGQKNTIPATQAAAGDGLLSQSTGFPPETALPLGAGGKPPTRKDFNGAFNLLSAIAFYSQKGWTFQYDATQAYYKGCIVMDATDGLRYECINDVAAGTILPSADTDNDYWREYSPGGVPLGTILPYAANAAEPPYSFLFCEGQAVSRTMYPDLFDLIGTTYGSGDGSTTFNIPNLIEAAMLNGSYTKTSYTTAGSATFTAPKTGFYKITVKGGGGGGQGGGYVAANRITGGDGGGEGGTTIGYELMTAGDTATVVVGAGGAGGAGNSNGAGANGANGGNSTVTVNLNTYTGGGGNGGHAGTVGGTGTIPGAAGTRGNIGNNVTYTIPGGLGGGNGGSIYSGTATAGGGGGGGSASTTGGNNGGAGGDGYATIEYIGISMKYMVKAYDAPTPSSAQIDLSQYASDLAARLTREQTPAFNKRDIVTTSGTYTAPVTGWYKITVKGGGGGGAGGIRSSSEAGYGRIGGSGGEGGTSIGYEHLTAGDTIGVVIGAGGTGGTGLYDSMSSSGNIGTSGGNTTATVNNKTYTGGGGAKGQTGLNPGGSGDISGADGGGSNVVYKTNGSYNFYSISTGSGYGKGGRGGNVSVGGSGTATGNNGDNGGDGVCIIEYFDPSLM